MKIFLSCKISRCSFHLSADTTQKVLFLFHIIVVQLLSPVRHCNRMSWGMPGFPVLYYLPEFAQTHVRWVNDAILLCHPLSPPSPPASIFPSIRVFFSESALCIRWLKYCSFSISISHSYEYSGLISFRIDWFDFKSLLQHQFESINSSVLSLLL